MSATFTAEDVAYLAELIRPHLATCDGDIEAAGALAEATERKDFERRICKTWEMAHVMAGLSYAEWGIEK